MRPRFLLTTLSIALLSPLAAQDAELQLKQTLAKITFAQQVTTIRTLASKSRHKETPQEMAAALQDTVQFTVSDFSTASVSAIRNRNLLEIATELPDHRQLQINYGTAHYSNKIPGEEYDVDSVETTVRWASNPERHSYSPFTLHDLAQTEPRYDTCTTYLTATLTASYQQQTAQWKPLYLLCGKDVLAVDLVMGNAVPFFWDANVYPAFLFASLYREDAVQDWLKAHASDTCTGAKSCYENGRMVIPKASIPTTPISHTFAPILQCQTPCGSTVSIVAAADAQTIHRVRQPASSWDS